MLGALVPLLDPVLLMIRQLVEPLRAAQLGQRQSPNHLVPHLLLAGLVGQQEDEVVAVDPQAAAGIFLCVDATDQLGDGDIVRCNLDGIEPHEDQGGLTVARVVGRLVGTAGEGVEVEDGPAEDRLDAVVELGAGLAGIRVLLLTAQDLGQVGLGQKAQRDVRAVVQIGRALHEAPPGVVDEAQVGAGREEVDQRSSSGVAPFRFSLKASV
jgi:hypothetical protein